VLGSATLDPLTPAALSVVAYACTASALAVFVLGALTLSFAAGAVLGVPHAVASTRTALAARARDARHLHSLVFMSVLAG